MLKIIGLSFYELFILPFIFPFIIGLSCMIIYRKIRFNKLIGIISIIIGILVVIINARINSDFWDHSEEYDSEGFDSKILFITIMISYIFTPLFVFSTMFTLKRREKKKSWKILTKFNSILLISIIIITIIGANSISISKISYEYEYRIVAGTKIGNEFYLYVPAPLSNEGEISNIIDNFKIIRGNVNISIVETKYGLAINLSAQEMFEIKVTGDKDKSSYNNVSLTTYNNTRIFHLYYYSQKTDLTYIKIYGIDETDDRLISFHIDVAFNLTGWYTVSRNNYWVKE